MKTLAPTHFSRRSQRGYALLLIMCFLALLLIAMLAIVPNVVTENQREKEEEMIWRGKQYARGVRLFYTKTHRFPTSLEDLTKPKTGIRFMRQAYKDPMNTADGSWRLIYVGPSGQLIGSLKSHSLGSTGQSALGSSFGSSPSSMTGSSNAAFSQSAFGNSPSANPDAFGSSSQASGNPATSNPPNPDSSTDAMSTPQPIASSDFPTIMGGNIIGVGSKINKKSFKWYDKAKNYRQFEFIWDPSKDVLTGAPLGSIPPNAPPFGNSPGSTTPNSPFSTGTPSAPNPNQNPSPNPSPNPGPPLQAPPPNPNQPQL